MRNKNICLATAVVVILLTLTGCFGGGGGSGSGGGVSKAKTGDLVVEVLNKETNKALAEQVTLTLGTSTPKTTTTGRAEFKSIAVGTLNLKVEAKGYKTVTQKVEIRAGSTTVKVQLEKENPTEPPELGSLEVTVKDSTTNKEITTATVIVGGRGALLKEGKYVAMDLEVGEHTLQVTAVGFKTYSKTVTIVADQAVKEEVMLEKLPAQLGELSGKITNEKDGKLITTEVTVNLAGTAKKVTGGMYSFTDLTPGKKTLKVTAPGFLERVTEVTIVAGKTEAKDISLKEEPPKLGNLEVMVKDSETTNAIPNAHVNIGSKTATFKDGKYIFTDLEAGKYTLEVSVPGYKSFSKKVDIKPQETTKTEVKLESIPPENLGKLTIKLKDKDTNDLLSNDVFVVYQVDGGEYLVGSHEIILENLLPGKTNLEFFVQGYSNLSLLNYDIKTREQEEVLEFTKPSNGRARISLRLIDALTKELITEDVSIEDNNGRSLFKLVDGVFEYINMSTNASATVIIKKDGYADEMPLQKKKLKDGEHLELICELKRLIANPIIEPNGGTYSDEVEVTITCPTQGVEIYYTLDGSEPKRGYSATKRYWGPFILKNSATIKAKAFRAGIQESEITSAEFNFPGVYGTIKINDDVVWLLEKDHDLTDYPGLSWNYSSKRLVLDGYNGPGLVENDLPKTLSTIYIHVISDSTIDGDIAEALGFERNIYITGNQGVTLDLKSRTSRVMGYATADKIIDIKNIIVKIKHEHDYDYTSPQPTYAIAGDAVVSDGAQLEIETKRSVQSVSYARFVYAVSGTLRLKDSSSAKLKATNEVENHNDTTVRGVFKLELNGSGTCEIEVSTNFPAQNIRAIYNQPTIPAGYDTDGAWNESYVKYY